jgi:hypothetical protein
MRSISLKNPKILVGILVLTNPLSWVLLLFAVHGLAVWLVWNLFRDSCRLNLTVSVRKTKRAAAPAPPSSPSPEPAAEPVADRPMPAEVHAAVVDLAGHAKRAPRGRAVAARSYAQVTKPKRRQRGEIAVPSDERLAKMSAPALLGLGRKLGLKGLTKAMRKDTLLARIACREQVSC